MPEPVPTVPELVELGPEFAVVVDWVNDGTAKNPKMRATRWHVTAKGHALMGEVMHRNAQEARARGEGDWHPAPSRTDIQERIAAAQAERRAAEQAAAWKTPPPRLEDLGSA